MSTVAGTPQMLTNRPLLVQPVLGVLTTSCADGRLQSSPVWFVLDGTDVLFSTMREFAKARPLRANPAATLLVIDPGDTNNWVEVRGSASNSRLRAHRRQQDPLGMLLPVCADCVTTVVCDGWCQPQTTHAHRRRHRRRHVHDRALTTTASQPIVAHSPPSNRRSRAALGRYHQLHGTGPPGAPPAGSLIRPGKGCDVRTSYR